MLEINSEMARQLAETKFWKTMSAKNIALFQLGMKYLCMPFKVFHKAVEEALDRPVWTHEFGSGGSLMKELLGEKLPPTLEEIINLIPEEKRIIIEEVNNE